MRGGGPLGRGSGRPPTARRTSRPDQVPVSSRPYAELREATLFHAIRSLTTAEHGSRQAGSQGGLLGQPPLQAGTPTTSTNRGGHTQPDIQTGKGLLPGSPRDFINEGGKKQVSIIPVDREGWRVLQGCVVTPTRRNNRR